MAANGNSSGLEDDFPDSDGSIDSQLEWELEEGIPQLEDPFIQKYFQGREALIAQEKKQRHDALFVLSLTPLARTASKILSSLRRKELKTVWNHKFEDEFAHQISEKSGGNIYPGMMFTLARQRMEKCETFKILEKMPKGALLHAHLDAMVDVEWLIEQAFEENMSVSAPFAMTKAKRDEVWGRAGGLELRFYAREDIKGTTKSIWLQDYTPNEPVLLKDAAARFPEGGEAGFKRWLMNKCIITEEESICHHHGLDAIWRKFQSTFPIIGWMLFYEPIFRKALQRLFGQLAADGITYVDLRCAFMFEWRKAGQSHDSGGYMDFFKTFGEEIEKFKASPHGQKVSFKGARMIWTVIRSLDNKMIIPRMKDCVAIKKTYPALICGFDFVAQEDRGRPLTDLTPVIFWFKKHCMQEGFDIPFFFHAGECLGDGDETDNNLFDAILLGTRRIGHGYSLYKHPLLIDMVKEKKILVESCPISNEILRLSSSVLSHSLPALLSRGVAVSLNNDDPAILGHGKNGLTHDYWQSFMAWENLGLEGIATMAENSLKWCAIEDQKPAAWTKDITEGYMGDGTKAALLKEWRTEFEKWCQWIVEEYAGEEDDDESDGL
jgi:adenosine deaminase CECR1